MKSIIFYLSTALRIITGLYLLSCHIHATGATDISVLNGLYGMALKTSIASLSTPNQTNTDNISQELKLIYKHVSDGKLICAFSTSIIDSETDLATGQIIPAEWIVIPQIMAQTAPTDLFNNVLLNKKTHEARKGLPILIVSTPQKTGTGWKSGLTESGYTAFEPSDMAKGRIARAMFYMATLYPADLWEGNGAVVFNDFNKYPTLTKEGMETYMLWHRTYPPTAEEISYNNLVEAVQGNRNLFIDYPELAEHIWGNKNNKPFYYQNEPESPSEPSSPEKIPLKREYALNETVWLWSPLIGNDTQWSVNGKNTNLKFIKASELGSGKHELSFKNEKYRGRIIIIIK